MKLFFFFLRKEIKHFDCSCARGRDVADSLFYPWTECGEDSGSKITPTSPSMAIKQQVSGLKNPTRPLYPETDLSSMLSLKTLSKN